jgi:DNA-binding NtrC family response regulator
MKKDGPIIVIDDDPDDREFFGQVLSGLVPNEIILLGDSTTVVEYFLKNDCHPFLIICDINMPKMNGFELRDAMLERAEIVSKKIPFLYFTGAWSLFTSEEASKRSINGFFHKPTSLDDLAEVLGDLIDYWKAR